MELMALVVLVSVEPRHRGHYKENNGSDNDTVLLIIEVLVCDSPSRSNHQEYADYKELAGDIEHCAHHVEVLNSIPIKLINPEVNKG